MFVFVCQAGAHPPFWVLIDRTSHVRIFVPIFHVLTPSLTIIISSYVYLFELLSNISTVNKFSLVSPGIRVMEVIIGCGD